MIKVWKHIHSLHEGQQNYLRYSMRNIKVITEGFSIYEKSSYTEVWSLLFMFYDDEHAVLITVNQLNIFILATLYFFFRAKIAQTSVLQFWVQSCCNHYQNIMRFFPCAKSIIAKCWAATERIKPAVKLKLELSEDCSLVYLVWSRECLIELNNTHVNVLLN